jgi:hypothetical protein
MKGAAKSSRAVGGKTGGSAFFPTNADFREGIIGAVELATGGETPTLGPPCVVVGAVRLRSDHKSIGSAQSASSGIFATVEPTDNRSQDQRPGAPGIGPTSGKQSADTEPSKL